MFGFVERVTRAKHRFCRENLSAYLDGELSARDRERVRQHLEQCEACQWDLRTLQQTVGLLRSLPQVKAPRSFEIPRSAPVPAAPFWMRPWAYGALQVATGAAAALLVITLAGHALSAPAMYAAPARDAALRAMEVQQAPAGPAAAAGEYSQGEEPPAVAEVAPAERQPHAEAPSTRGAEMAGPPLPTPTSEDGGNWVTADAQVLTPEEAARATAAPFGMGGGKAAPTGQPEAPEPGGAGGLPEATAPAPAAEGAPTAEAPTEPALVKALPLAPQPQAEPSPHPALPLISGEEVAGTVVEGAPAPTRLARLRYGLSAYPWRWLAAGSGLLLAALVTATLWLRAKRAHWP
jgi:anti-sigma factor RsiW